MVGRRSCILLSPSLPSSRKILLIAASTAISTATTTATVAVRAASPSFVCPSFSSHSFLHISPTASSCNGLATSFSFKGNFLVNTLTRTRIWPQTRLFSSSSISSPVDNTQSNKNENVDMVANHQPQTFRVVSYNLLSSHLADPTYHTKCDPKHLCAKNRFPKIIAKLQEQLDETDDNIPVIFCLQEVSHDWAKQLHVFFARNGYHFITALYGRTFNGYMGIGTAYPLHYYDTVEVDICRLSDTRKGGWPRPREGIDFDANVNESMAAVAVTKVTGLFKRYIFRPLVDTAQYVGIMKGGDGWDKDKDPWEKSQYRSNQFVAVKLQRKGDSNVSSISNRALPPPPPVWIGNYHMPCAFRDPAVMTLHCDLVAQRIQYLASKDKTSDNGNSDSFILAGDFNIMPDSAQYQFMTAGKIGKDKDISETDNTQSPIPPDRYGVKWESDIIGMKSAYASYDKNNGKESDFTNYAHNGALSDESFIGTLDYIFLSGNCEHRWRVVDVLDLKHRDEVLDGPFPNEKEPSDHVMIAATLEVSN